MITQSGREHDELKSVPVASGKVNAIHYQVEVQLEGGAQDCGFSVEWVASASTLLRA